MSRFDLDHAIPFDFILDGSFLRNSLENWLEKHSFSKENVLTIEYIETIPPPSLTASWQHDDWISSVAFHLKEDYILTGCFDNMSRIWNYSGECVGIVQSDAPIKTVQWLDDFQFIAGDQGHVITAYQVDHFHVVF